MHFHLTHVVAPQPLQASNPMHGMHGYKEVIDTIQWGLEQLGHTVEYGQNCISTTGVNVVFGIQIMSMPLIDGLPSDTIVCNLEQIRGHGASAMKPQILEAAKRFRIWEYSEANLAVWREMRAKDVRLVPVGYSPVLRRIAKPPVQDIDVLFYGLTSQDRLSAFHSLAHSGLTTLFVCGMYGDRRDELVARSKLVANVSWLDKSKVFEIVRVSYLLANRKAVVAVVDADTAIDDDMRSAVRVTSLAGLVGDCKTLIGDDSARAALEEAGFRVMQRRDIRTALTAALAD